MKDWLPVVIVLVIAVLVTLVFQFERVSVTETVTVTVTHTVTHTEKSRAQTTTTTRTCRLLGRIYNETNIVLSVRLVEENTSLGLPKLVTKKDKIRVTFTGGGKGQKLHIHIGAYTTDLRSLSIQLYNPTGLVAHSLGARNIVFNIPYPDNYTLVVEPLETVKLYNVTVWIEECK